MAAALRFLPLLALGLLMGCAGEPTLIGTWNGEMPENEAIHTGKGDVRANLVLDLRATHTFHASVLTASIDGTWESTSAQLVLHPQKATVNGKDYEDFRPFLTFMPKEQRAAMEAYDPTKAWTLEIKNGGSTLYLPSKAKGMTSFTFRKAM